VTPPLLKAAPRWAVWESKWACWLSGAKRRADEMEFRILGPLEVADRDSVSPLGSAKQRGLLSVLFLSANEAVSSDRLIDELWGEQSPQSRSDGFCGS